MAVASFGDGTANSGILYETLNLSSILRLPVVYVCQNNQYATSIPATYAIAGNSISQRARAFGIHAEDVDGNDVLEVRSAVAAAIQRAREGGGPSLVHALTYRIGGHFMSDPEIYRTSSEVEEWRQRDPIKRLTERLISSKMATREDLLASAETIAMQMQEVVDQALEAEDPDSSQLPISAYGPSQERAEIV